MSFDSLTYLLFLPSVVLLHWLIPSRARWMLLLAASLVFYASWNLPLTFLLLTVIAVTWLAGILLAKASSGRVRKGILAAAVFFCVGMLCVFKYSRFLADSLAHFLRAAGYPVSWEPWNILLPVGISFYIFQSLSYVIDVYRDPSRCELHPGFYALYIAFFPQLVAGPIERADRLIPQLRTKRQWKQEDLVMGVRLILCGLFRKIVLADLCGRFVDNVYEASSPDGSAVFLGTLLFAIQIYNDFAGYSEIARGSAQLLGIRLLVNFDRPYLSGSLREFWRRWHISLGRWFTDYVYIPLGGSRRGLRRRLCATLMVFALSGLWHGANWTFLVWGLFHGLLLCAGILRQEIRQARADGEVRSSAASGIFMRLCTFAAVNFSWIFFRAQSLSHAFFLICRLFSPWDPGAGLALVSLQPAEWLWLAVGLLQSRFLYRLSREECRNPHDMVFVYLLLCIALAWLIRLGQNTENAFIYFQF